MAQSRRVARRRGAKPQRNGVRRPIYAVFEGGGAKGVAHVGALEAIEDNKLNIIGVAGTSAGALVSLMIAIGYESPDIMGRDRPATDNILSDYDMTPIDLLGRAEWHSFARLMRRGRGGLISGALLGFFGACAFAPRFVESVWRGVGERGHFNTDAIRAFVDDVIRARLSDINEEAGLGREVPAKDITFRQLADGWPTVIPLKVVVTDVDKGRLEVLNAHATPDVVVAEAVAASISIPLVFRPAAIPSFRAGDFADGGLVSNLPIWGFSEEKLAYEREHHDEPPVPVIGFSLGAPASETPATSVLGRFSGYMKRVVNAALQGSQGTTTRYLEDVTVIPLTTALATLQFDGSEKDFKEARQAGHDCAHKQLRHVLQAKPDRIKTELDNVRAEAVKCINAQGPGQPLKLADLRIAIVRPFGDYSLRVMESVGRGHDSDDRLLLDRRQKGPPQAFRERETQLTSLTEPPRDYRTRYEFALARTTVRTQLSIPIFDDSDSWNLPPSGRPEPAGVLAIDSDLDLAKEFSSPKLRDMLVQRSTVLYAAFKMEAE